MPGTDRHFRIALLIQFIAFIIIRRFFQYQLHREKQEIIPKSSSLDRALVVIESLAFFGGVIVYLMYPEWFQWAALPLPNWVRWIGFVIGLLGIIGFYWVHSVLGKNWSAWLDLKKDQILITRGPYRSIRHPMYTAIYLLYIGWALLTANWFLSLSWIGTFTLLTATRVKNEETMMVDRFGESYKAYMQETGRFLPKR